MATIGFYLLELGGLSLFCFVVYDEGRLTSSIQTTFSNPTAWYIMTTLS